ncbi:MAG: Branched-chain amino acid transport ATP-binding protein LivF [Modestobacter sp.]|jgi:ABC-type branched-subunit amino acid transport system ATPase component|nr:Branched-chain amino acid transport ATP-binding protein LivF [Modestobacter sp.]MCW2578305.1 Branched-chain amino acid transport ATP-binding protein LivF [Modestobacter sp.]MCW2620351.1 Branched-chain amino acid transport ATP-binding protein LivF [Modestobacter sp.]
MWRRGGTSAGGSHEAADGPLLDVRDLSVVYANGAHGGNGVDLSVRAGEIVAVLGRNGAGKTSLLRGIAGFLPSEHIVVHGHVVINGVDLAGRDPMRSFRQGIVMVPERDKVFAALTVVEHLRLATRGGQDPNSPCMFGALDRLRGRQAGLLSGGERQMLALETAFRNDPKLLLVDEASLGLAPVIVKELMSRLREIATERNTAVIAVEQDASAALRLADRLYVMNHGRVVWEGLAQDATAADLAAEYLGTVR